MDSNENYGLLFSLNFLEKKGFIKRVDYKSLYEDGSHYLNIYKK